MMLTNKTTAIFDLDGTLVDSMSLWGEIDIEYLKKYNLQVPKGLQKEVEGLAFTQVAEYFKERFHLEDSVEEIKKEWNAMAMDKYQQEVTLKPGVKPFLEYLSNNGIQMGVASSNSIELVEAALKAHNIHEYFSCVLTCCQVSKGKPAPDVYLEVARRLHSQPEDCIVFEDIPHGIMAGKAANMSTCAVYDRYSEQYDFRKRELADYYIHSYEEILTGTYEELS